MNEKQLELAQQLKDEIDKNEPKPETTKSSNETLLALQKQASQTAKASKDAEWEMITSYNMEEIPPLAMAKLYAAMPWGQKGTSLTIPQALMLAIAAKRTGLNPDEGEIFVLPSGKIGKSAEGREKELTKEGMKIGKPRFTPVERDKKISLTRWEDGKQVSVTLNQEPGMKCEMTVNGEPCEYTCWLGEWYMPGNPNWFNRMEWMLQVRAKSNLLKLNTGAGMSEEIFDIDATGNPAPVVKQEVKAPKETPFGGK